MHLDSVELGQEIWGHCQVAWNETAYLVIGGQRCCYNAVASTYFIDIESETRSMGPPLNSARFFHGCAELVLNGKTYILAAGGTWGGRFSDIRSTEILDKDQPQNGWITGDQFNLPFNNFEWYLHQMVSSSDKKSVFGLGGYNDLNREVNNIYEFACTGQDLDSCQWKDTNSTMKYKRRGHVAFAIPNELAIELCNN